MYEKRRPQSTCKMASEKKWVKKWKLSVLSQSHFEASQCPQVLGSNRNGEKAAGAQAISGRDPGGRPVRGRVENAQKIKNRQNSDEKGFENYEILWWQLKFKIEPWKAK